MRALLLAAGLGTRLRPLTDRVPKCLVPIAGRPLLDHWLEACARGGFTEVLVNTHYLPDAVERYVRSQPHALEVRTVHEPVLLGTAGTLRANWSFVAREDPFLFAHADNYTSLDLARFARDFAAARRPDTLMAAALFRTPTPETCGIVELDGTGHLAAFHEKSARPPGNLANGAIYLGTPALGPFLRLEEAGFLDFSTEVMPRLMGRVWGDPIDGFLADIGTLEQYELWKHGPTPQALRSLPCNR